MRARPAIVLAVVAVLVVALAVIAAIVSGGRDRPTLDATTPEGVVQLYVSALFEDDAPAAAKYLDPALNCADSLRDAYIAESFRVAVVKTSTHEDAARVELQIEEGAGLLDGSWSHREDFTLRRDSGTWLITGEPWPLYECE